MSRRWYVAAKIIEQQKITITIFFTAIQFYQLWCSPSHLIFLQSCPGTSAAASLGWRDKGHRLMWLTESKWPSGNSFSSLLMTWASQTGKRGFLGAVLHSTRSWPSNQLDLPVVIGCSCSLLKLLIGDGEMLMLYVLSISSWFHVIRTCFTCKHNVCTLDSVLTMLSAWVITLIPSLFMPLLMLIDLLH